TGQALAIAAGIGLSATAFAAGAASPTQGDAHAQWQLIEKYCFDCHNTEYKAGSVAFDTKSADNSAQDSKVWETANKKHKDCLMPPPGREQPGKEATAQLVNWLETTLDAAQTRPYAGHIPLRRLNRREYANAIQDLIGLRIDPAIYLPTDAVVDGFDT